MKRLKIILVLLVLINSTLQNPLNTDDYQLRRAEEKNWKIKSGHYNEKSVNNGLFDNPPTTYRLPNDTIPIRYDIHLTTDVDKANFNFFGRVKIHIRAVEKTDFVTLQYRDITMITISLINITTEEVIVDNLNFEYFTVYEFLRIQLPLTLQPNDEAKLHITYHGTLKTNNAGFYRAYYTLDEKTVYYAVTQFESTDARHAFPCYDEPGIRAPIGLQLQHDESYSAYSNMPLIDTIPVEGTNYVISKFNDTPPMQTYLLAFLISPFDFVSNNDGEILQRIFAKPTSIANGDADFALSIADPIIKKLVNHFGVNYTLSKLDHAAITQFAAGAMENWGFVTYAERYLLLTSTSSTSAKRNIIATMAHEDAHQFFGNLVSPQWWSDLWLNEGFATLYEYYIPHLLYPDDGWMEEFRVSEINYCFNYDVLSRSTVPMHYYVETPRAIDNRFDSISYSKSGVVLNMFQEALSVTTFTKGLRKYLNKMSYKAAVPQDLFSSIQEAYDEDYSGNTLSIDHVMGSWVYQAGYPLVSVSRTQNSTLIFTQRRYPESTGEVYSVPISYATNNRMDFERKTAGFWLTNEKLEISQDNFGMERDNWIILNIQQTGYYRVAYSSELWRAIGKGLQDNHSQIHFVNRRVLQSELFLGYSTLKELLASDVLEVLSYLINENEYLIWSDAGAILRSLNATLFGTSVYPEYLKFIGLISKKQLDSVGMEAIDGEPVENRNLRNQVKTYNCYALDEECLNHELEKLILYKENSQENPVPDFCSGFRNANALLYVHYLNEIIENPLLPQRSRIISSIGCSLNENLLKLAALIAEDDSLTNTERTSIINNMMTSSTIGFKIAFEYLERNVDQISSFRTNLGISINTLEYSERLDKILDEALAENFITGSNAQTLRNSIKSNLEWQERHFNAVDEWFEYFYGEPTTTTERETTSSDTTTNSNTPVGTTTETISTTPGSANGIFLSIAVFIVWTLVTFIN